MKERRPRSFIASGIRNRSTVGDDGRVPGLSAFADFYGAVSHFPVDDLGLTAEAAALDLARSSVESTGMLLLGEVHGVSETR